MLLFLKSLKLNIIILSLSVSIILSLLVLYINAIKNLEYEKQKNLYLESSLKTQNKAIEKIQLETQAFNKNKENLQKEVIAKYDNIIQNSNFNTSNFNVNYANFKDGIKAKTQKAPALAEGFNNKAPALAEGFNNKAPALAEGVGGGSHTTNTLIKENQQLKEEILLAKELLKHAF